MDGCGERATDGILERNVKGLGVGWEHIPTVTACSKNMWVLHEVFAWTGKDRSFGGYLKHGPKLMETWDKFNPSRHEETREESSENLNVTWEISRFKCSCDIHGMTETNDIH